MSCVPCPLLEMLGDDDRCRAGPRTTIARWSGKCCTHREPDRARLQHLGADRRPARAFPQGDRAELSRLGDDARVGGVDALDVGVDVAAVGLDPGRERDRRRIRSAAAERRQAPSAVDCPGSLGSPPPSRPTRRLSSIADFDMRRSARQPWTPTRGSAAASPCKQRALTPIACSVIARRPGGDLLAATRRRRHIRVGS